ncbi:hypothetical protein GCM10022251_25440 [Phytohabitans flavus]|uniref:Uncharacterized protein n=1 Tax=Phytohabitans flavus TaxID=1076124 RepID=A0A6F8XQY4_9ACTN|nr:hypothetical protein [Phytohabitans flavus]BCB76252.1 hypothetical protein Pflav_026620 [Phytohabitans flavus]
MSAEEAIARADRVEVNVRHLGNIKTYLADVRGAIPEYREDFKAADKALRTGGDQGRSALGSEHIEVVRSMHAQIGRMHEILDNNLKDLAAGLDKTGDAVATLAEKYKSVEARNRLAVSALQKLLDQ